MPNLKQHVIESGIHKPESAFHTCGIGVLPERAAEVAPFVFTPELEALVKGRTIVGYCGSVGLTNNLHDFVEYMERCDRDDVMFVVAGDGADRQQFQSRLEGRNNVMFLGRIAANQVQGFLRRCDILFLSTLPSKVWDYGQSMNKVVDYMLAAKYIVAQYTGYPSFINEAECGVFTDGAGLKDCLDAAIDMPPATRDAAGVAGRKWLLEHQNYETLARDYLKKIEACVKGARPDLRYCGFAEDVCCRCRNFGHGGVINGWMHQKGDAVLADLFSNRQSSGRLAFMSVESALTVDF